MIIFSTQVHISTPNTSKISSSNTKLYKKIVRKKLISQQVKSYESAKWKQLFAQFEIKKYAKNK